MSIPEFIIIPCFEQEQQVEEANPAGTNGCCENNSCFEDSSSRRWEESSSSSLHELQKRRCCEPPQCPARNSDHQCCRHGEEKRELKGDSRPCCPRRSNSFQKDSARCQQRPCCSQHSRTSAMTSNSIPRAAAA